MLFLISVFVAILALIVTYYKRAYQFWKEHNLKHYEPSIPWGNTGNPFFRPEPFSEVFAGYHNRLKQDGHKHGGMYSILRPIYMPVDLEYVKNVLAKDFSYFTDRGIFYNERDDPLSAHLFAIDGPKWRQLRVKLTPTFTSGKMKMMFHTLVECSDLFKTAMDKLVDEDVPIDIKDALGCFTTDIIGSCAFGLECNSMKNNDSPFRQHGRRIFQRDIVGLIKNIFVITLPTLARALRLRQIRKDTSDFFMNVVKDTVEYREKHNTFRNDFLQLLIDLKNGSAEEKANGHQNGATTKGLTIEEIAAQCFVFFLAGFETSSTAMTFALFELAKSQDLQEKARREVVEVMEKHDGKLTYEALGEMKYLGQCIDESMRLYPPLSLLFRQCVKDYKVPDTDVVIPEGTRVFISTLAIHRDPEYYPNPMEFDPERFSDENKKTRHPYAYLPFGEGPRNCIGLRFGLMQSKVGMATFLKNFRFTVHEKTKQPIKLSKTFITAVEGEVWLHAERL